MGFFREQGPDPKEVTAQFITDYAQLLSNISFAYRSHPDVPAPLDNILDLLESISNSTDIRRVRVEYRDTSFRDHHYISDSEDPGVHVSVMGGNQYRFDINAYGGIRDIGTTSDMQDAGAQYRRGQIHTRRTDEIASHDLHLNVQSRTPRGLGSYQVMNAWVSTEHGVARLDHAEYNDRNRYIQQVQTPLLISGQENLITDIHNQVINFIHIRDST